MEQLPTMEVVVNDLREHPSCPHGILIVVYSVLSTYSVTVFHF